MSSPNIIRKLFGGTPNRKKKGCFFIHFIDLFSFIAMSVIFVLIIISILVAGSFLAGFLWAVRSGQYEDTDSPAVRMLLDDKKQDLTKP